MINFQFKKSKTSLVFVSDQKIFIINMPDLKMCCNIL
jgi:hypothetical protein